MKIAIEVSEVVGGFKIEANSRVGDGSVEIELGEAYAAKPNQIAVRIKELIAPAFEKKS